MQFFLVFVPILDWCCSNPTFHGSFCNSHRHRCDESGVKRLRYDVVFSKGKFGCPIGNVNLLGNCFFGQMGKSVYGSHFHGFINFGGAYIKGTPKNEWKTKYVVDLIRKIRTPRSHNRIFACGNSKVVVYFWVWISHGKNNRIWRHRF